MVLRTTATFRIRWGLNGASTRGGELPETSCIVRGTLRVGRRASAGDYSRRHRCENQRVEESTGVRCTSPRGSCYCAKSKRPRAQRRVLRVRQPRRAGPRCGKRRHTGRCYRELATGLALQARALAEAAQCCGARGWAPGGPMPERTWGHCAGVPGGALPLHKRINGSRASSGRGGDQSGRAITATQRMRQGASVYTRVRRTRR